MIIWDTYESHVIVVGWLPLNFVATVIDGLYLSAYCGGE